MHLNALNLYQKILPHAIPTTPKYLHPTLWHPDLSQQNILVSESGPVSFSGFIDWQFATTEPYYAQAKFPPAFTYLGKRIDRTASDVPMLPPGFEEASKEEQNAIEEELMFAKWHTYYDAHFISEDERRAILRDHPYRFEMTVLPIHALRCWSDGYFLLRKRLWYIIDAWEPINPYIFPPVDLSDIEVFSESLRWMTYECIKKDVFDDLGLHIQSDGKVTKESFQQVSEKMLKYDLNDLPVEISLGDEYDYVEKLTMKWPLADGGISHYLS